MQLLGRLFVLRVAHDGVLPGHMRMIAAMRPGREIGVVREWHQVWEIALGLDPDAGAIEGRTRSAPPDRRGCCWQSSQARPLSSQASFQKPTANSTASSVSLTIQRHGLAVGINLLGRQRPTARRSRKSADRRGYARGIAQSGGRWLSASSRLRDSPPRCRETSRSPPL